MQEVKLYMDKTNPYEVRCHEWGDDSDYHIKDFSTRESAQTYIDARNKKRPADNLYEHWYIADWTKEMKTIDLRLAR